ncbi:hypothetical protein [Nocardioides montaniterrae]
MLERHWTGVSPETYAEEARLVGDLAALDVPGERSVHLGAGGAPEVASLLERIRDDEEPLWRGVESITQEGTGVRVAFREGVDPALRKDGDVDVACVLYGSPAGPSTTGG